MDKFTLWDLACDGFLCNICGDDVIPINITTYRENRYSKDSYFKIDENNRVYTKRKNKWVLTQYVYKEKGTE